MGKSLGRKRFLGPPEIKTADFTVDVQETGTVFSNEGASGTIVASMPAATPGQQYTFVVSTAQAFRIDPNGTETISLPSSGVPGAAGKYLGSSTIGGIVTLYCAVAGNWLVAAYTGSWAAEA